LLCDVDFIAVVLTATQSLTPSALSACLRIGKVHLCRFQFVFANTVVVGVTLSEFLDETYPTKARGMGLPYGENFIILTSTIFDRSTHVMERQTDGRAIACSTLGIYAVAS